MADAPLHVRGRVDGMGDLDDTGSYIGFAYFTPGAEHRFKVALPAAELLVAEIREALSLPERKEGDSQLDWIYEAGNWESTYRYADRNDLLDYADSFEVTEFQALTNGPRLWAFVAYTDNGTERVWCTSREDADAKCAAMKDKWLDDNNDPGSTSPPGDPNS